MKSSKISLYIHWPYCLNKCPYCDFASQVAHSVDENRLYAGYFRDLKLYLNGQTIDTIFFGGGTPSLMSIGFMERLFNDIENLGHISQNAEITLEANPDAIDKQKMQDFRALGINRLSLGVQSLNEADLKFLGRTHTVQTALTRIRQAQEVFHRINIDLIYARPHQTGTAWEKELRTALDLGLTHYSLYQLTIEENTVFGRKKIPPAAEQTAVDLYRLTDEIMNGAHIPAYEVSNYAKAGEECRHNLVYWHMGDYIGIGPAAHGRINGQATQNPRFVKSWLEQGPIIETLTSAQKETERLLMGLRLRQEWFDAHNLDPSVIQKLAQKRLLEVKGTHIRPTLDGILILDQLILDLMPA